MDIAQDFIEAFPGIAKHLINLEGWETLAQDIETGDGQEMIVAIGRGEGAGEGPKQREAIIDDIEGFGFIAEVMFSGGRFAVFWIGRLIGVGFGLIGAGIVDIGRLRIAGGSVLAVLNTSVSITGATFFALLTGGTGTFWARLATIGGLMTAMYVRAGSNQLAIGRNTHPAPVRVAGKGGLGGDEIIGHQTLPQAGLAKAEPLLFCVANGHAKSRRDGQIIHLKAQSLAIPASPFWRVEFPHQS